MKRLGVFKLAYNLTRIKRLFDSESIDLIIASTKENCRYFTGYSPVIKTLNPYLGQSYAVLHCDCPEEVSIVHSAGESDQVLDADVPVRHVETYGIFYREYDGLANLTPQERLLQQYSHADSSSASPSEALKRLLQELSLASPLRQIGYDDDGMPRETLADLQRAFPDVRWKAMSQAIRRVRRQKTASEIEMLARSACINEAAVHEAVKKVRSGTSEVEVSLWFNQALVSQGAQPSLTMIKAGRAAVGGQRRQNPDILLHPGDMLWFDSDAIYEGFWSDIARVYAIEQVSPLLLKRYQALRNGMLAACSFIRPGVTGRQVFAHVMETVHRSGFTEYRRHHVGHGIGLEPYELPILSPSDDNIIEEGMILSVETPYYEFGVGALHIEDPLLVGATGNRFLTSNPAPELQIL